MATVSCQRAWREETLDLWRDNGAFIFTGLAPMAMGGPAFFDRIELMQVCPVGGRGSRQAQTRSR